MLPIMAESRMANEQRQGMIRMALEDRAPKTFLAMKKAGSLEAFVQKQERLLMAAFQEAKEQILHREIPKNLDYPEKVQRIEQAFLTAWHRIQEPFLDFSDQTTESPKVA